jgi:hypothetical protein
VTPNLSRLVDHRNASTLLPAVLKGIEGKKGEARYVLTWSKDPEDGAGFLWMIHPSLSLNPAVAERDLVAPYSAPPCASAGRPALAALQV